MEIIYLKIKLCSDIFVSFPVRTVQWGQKMQVVFNWPLYKHIMWIGCYKNILLLLLLLLLLLFLLLLFLLLLQMYPPPRHRHRHRRRHHTIVDIKYMYSYQAIVNRTSFTLLSYVIVTLMLCDYTI